jgi:cytochrome c-type biogenesis protein CcmH
MKRASILVTSLLLLAAPVTVMAETVLPDPAQEARAQALGREIRCVVCENEPVALSQAEIAVDMRDAIRARIAAGDTDAEVRRYFASRYGDFVLLRPKVGIETAALWGAPLILLLAGALGLFWFARRNRVVPLANTDGVDDDAARAALDRYRDEQKSSTT